MLKWYKSHFFKSNDFPINILHTKPHPSCPLHIHDFTEMVIIGQGKAKHITDYGTSEISEGDVFVIIPGEKHGYKCNDENFEVYNIIFDFSTFEKSMFALKKSASFKALFNLEPILRQKGENIKKMKLSPYQLTISRDILSRIQEELSKKQSSYEDMCRALITELFVFICRCYEEVPISTHPELIRIAHVLEFIEKNYDKKISQSELLKICHMSRSSFQRTFLKSTGTTPKKYIIKVRLAHAVDLIATKKYNITGAAYATGFSDSNYFSRIFRRYFKMSPSTFIKQCSSIALNNLSNISKL